MASPFRDKIGMTVSSARRQFTSVIIQHVVWLCARFTLSYRDVE